MANAKPHRRIISARDALYDVRETVMQTGYSPAEIVKLLKIVVPDYRAKLTPAGEIEIEDEEIE